MMSIIPPNPARRLRWLGARLGLGRDWKFVLLASLIGCLIAGVALSFMWLIHLPAHLLTDVSASWRPWLIFGFPMVGALATGCIVYYLAPEARGHGVPEVLHAINRRKSRIHLRVAVAKLASAVCTIGTGGSGGAEGPIVQIGAAVGSSVGGFMRTSPQDTATLLGCGAAAGIASVFNAPIAGIFFVLEILLRDFSIRTFTPIVIAAIFSAAVTQAARGGSFEVFPLLEEMKNATFYLAEIPNYILLGICCGGGAIVFVRVLYFIEDLYAKWRLHSIIKPVTGAALLGCVGLTYALLTSSTATEAPPFYGNGYPVIENLLDVEYYLTDAPGRLMLALIALGALKALATSLTLGSGGSGGVFAPSLMLGACMGGAFGTVVSAFDLAPHGSPAHYALVGMAAMVAATTHAPLTAILIVYEITRNYQIILPLMLAAIIATIVARLIMPDSIYTLKLRRRGIILGGAGDLTILRRMYVSDVPLVPAITVRVDDSAQRLIELSENQSATDMVVIDANDRYVGMITHEELRSALVHREAIPLLQVSELFRTDLPTVSLEDSLDVVLQKFSRHDALSLPVMAEGAGLPVQGLITRARLMAVYHRALARD